MAITYGSRLIELSHPFGNAGALTSTGSQYGATVSTATTTDFVTVEESLIDVPTNSIIKELEVGLTIGMAETAVTTDAVALRYRIRNSTVASTTGYDTLLASSSFAAVVSSSNLTPISMFGIKTPSDGTYFTGKGSFYILAEIAGATVTTAKIQGAMNSLSYVLTNYYLV